MEEDLVKRSVANAISRGDVDTLVVLYYDNPEVRELIDESTEEVAHLNGFDIKGLSFKEFVVDVYDPTQAKREYEQGTVLQYLKEGGISRARNVAHLLAKDITRGIRDNLPKRIKLIKQLLRMFKRKGEHNSDIQAIVDSDQGKSFLVRSVLSNLASKRDDVLLEYFFTYPRVLEIYQTQIVNSVKEGFAKYYIDKYYPLQGIYVMENVLRQLTMTPLQKFRAYQSIQVTGSSPVVKLENIIEYITDKYNLTNEEKDVLDELVRENEKIGTHRLIGKDGIIII